MANDTQTPETPTLPTPSLWERLKQQVAALWDKDKGIFLLVAIAALIVKFRDLIIDILVNSAKRVDNNAKKEDSKLSDQETQLKQQADEAVQQAQKDAPKDNPVDDDWYKKGN